MEKVHEIVKKKKTTSNSPKSQIERFVDFFPPYFPGGKTLYKNGKPLSNPHQ